MKPARMYLRNLLLGVIDWSDVGGDQLVSTFIGSRILPAPRKFIIRLSAYFVFLRDDRSRCQYEPRFPVTVWLQKDRRIFQLESDTLADCELSASAPVCRMQIAVMKSVAL